MIEGWMAGIAPEATKDTYDIQCFPLYSLLMAAAGNVTVNYLRNPVKLYFFIFQLLEIFHPPFQS